MRAGAAGGYDPDLRVVGRGSPLVFVPGIDGTGRMFYRQAPRLAPSYRVATYRLRDDAPTMDALVGDLGGVLDAAAPDGGPAVVVGESFGGALALSFALARPERVRALVALNTFACFGARHRLRLARAVLPLVPWRAVQVARRLGARRLHSPHTSAAEVRRALELTRDATRRGYLGRLGMLARYDVRARLPELRPPALFLAADQDRLVPAVAHARELAALAPGARLYTLAGHGHVAFVAPDVDLGAILRAWLPAP